MEFTPGPWHVFDENDPFPGIEASNPRQSIVIWGTGSAECGVSGRTRKEQLANARLIAAAPDLLDALREIANGQGAFSTDPLTHASNTIDDMKELARAAIAKATA